MSKGSVYTDLMDDQQERKLRHRAIRWCLRQVKVSVILRHVGRSRSWLKKWKRRFDVLGWIGLRSVSRAPHQQQRRWDAATQRAVVAARRRLEGRAIGLIGAAAIQDELEASGWQRCDIPSVSAIKRLLHQAGVTGDAEAKLATPYFPQPTPRATYPLQQLDWTERYLAGGAKVYAFHSLEVGGRGMHQTLAHDKSWPTVRAHLLKSWEILGIPAGLQMDNDAAFCGGYKVPRVLGACVRLCLYVGCEPIFIPYGEPERNGLVERLHALWDQAVWKRRRFRGFAQVQRTQPRFQAWYATYYEDEHHAGSAPSARSVGRHRRLTAREAIALPEMLPITAGRIHFLRRVEPDGTIRVLNDTWRVTRRLAGQYVWATIVTHEQRLRIYHKRTAHGPVRLIKEFRYELPEPVRPVPTRFRHVTRRRRMDTML